MLVSLVTNPEPWPLCGEGGRWSRCSAAGVSLWVCPLGCLCSATQGPAPEQRAGLWDQSAAGAAGL